MSYSVRPHRRQPTRLHCPWDSPGKNTGVGCHCLLQRRKVKVKSLSHVRPSVTPWTVAHQAPPPMGFSRQEYWSRVPLPSPGIGRASHISGVPCGSMGEKSTPNTGDTGSIPRSGGSLEEGMETHFNILARKIPWAGVLVGYSPWSRKSLT